MQKLAPIKVPASHVRFVSALQDSPHQRGKMANPSSARSAAISVRVTPLEVC